MANMAGTGNQLSRLIPAQNEATTTATSDVHGRRGETPSSMMIRHTCRW